jgi:hypothetical protein
MKLKTLTVGAATIGLIALAGPAFAAGPPYTVSVGGSSAAGSHPFTATSTGTVVFNAKNNAGTVINMNCTSVSAAGTVTSGTGVNPVATITSTTWNGCKIPGGNATVTQSGNWNLTGTGSASTADETIAGYVGNVSAGVALTASPGTCSFTAAGPVAGGAATPGKANGSFNETTQQIVINETGYTGNLTLSGVGPCLGQLQNGNKANFAATLNVTSPDGAIKLS